MMSLNPSRAALAVVLAGFDGMSPPESLLADLRGGLGGIVLFKRNLEDPAQIAALLKACRTAAGDRPLVTSVDQEGGRVVRLRQPFTVLPPARRLGRCGSVALTEEAGRLVGAELRAVGLSANYAPVLDVDTNPDSPVIGDRSFGADADTVIRHGLAFARGLWDGGVHPVAKHFPGHGDAGLDSHADLPRIEHDKTRLESVELAPFSAYVRCGIGAVMTAHVVYPALDPLVPATVSRPIVTGLLRQRLRWKGPVVSDDLEMGAIARFASAPQAAIQAIDAGVDGLLICRSVEMRAAVVEALTKRAEVSPAFAIRLERAAARLMGLTASLGRGPDISWIGSNDHRSRQERLWRAIDESPIT